MIHIPVLLAETVHHLDLKADDIIIDGTIGYGGHSEEILKHIPEGHLYGFDQDPNAIAHCQEKFKHAKNVTLIHKNFSEISHVLSAIDSKNLTPTKILLDLGLSSFHLDSSNRGFTFSKSEPLDMRMNPNTSITAASLLKTSSEKELLHIFEVYGDLHNAQKFVKAILHERIHHDITTTDHLVTLIKKNFFFKNNRKLMMKIFSQVFQGLRIAVNDEWNTLILCLNTAFDILPPGGKIAIITFHSGEDRLIKNWAKEHKGGIKKGTSNVIQASQKEIKQNSRSKSAKLRILERQNHEENHCRNNYTHKMR
jgi:16S rRNA (cytosine1402-N4)-methyltransferase